MEDKNTKNNKQPDVNKPYVLRNFVREIKRVTWPNKKKNYYYFLYTIIFILILIAFFALISLGASKIIELIGAK